MLENKLPPQSSWAVYMYTAEKMKGAYFLEDMLKTALSIQQVLIVARSTRVCISLFHKQIIHALAL